MKNKLTIVGTIAVLFSTFMIGIVPARAGSWSLTSKIGVGSVSSSISYLNYAWSASPTTWYGYNTSGGSPGDYIQSAGYFELTFTWSGSGTPGATSVFVDMTTTEQGQTNDGMDDTITLWDDAVKKTNSTWQDVITLTGTHRVWATVVPAGTGYTATFDGPSQSAYTEHATSMAWAGQAGCGVTSTLPAHL